MDTLEKVFTASHTTGPYPRAIRVQIVEHKVDEKHTIIGIADKTDGVKALCYSADLMPKLKNGSTVLIRNFQRGRSCLLFSASTTVKPSPPLRDVPAGYMLKAREAVHPPPPQMVNLRDVALSPQNTWPKPISITGKVVQDEVARTVAGNQKVRNIKVQQGETTRPVALWNAVATSPLKAGDRVTISHVIPKDDKFLKQLALFSTGQTDITIHEQETKMISSPILAAEEDEDNNIIITIGDENQLKQLTLPSSKAELLLLLDSTVEERLETLNDDIYNFETKGTLITDMKLHIPPSCKKSLQL